MPVYQGSERASAALASIARDYRLQSLSAWTIATLRLRCALVSIARRGRSRYADHALRRDTRVSLVEPLHEFATLSGKTGPPPPGRAAIRTPAAPAYNDPYLQLQHGFASLQAARAQRWARGRGVRVALIDSGVDRRHPDLHDRIGSVTDFVGDAGNQHGEQHGTEMAGVLAAVANNRIGIVGIAPDARIDVYRACWELRGGDGGSRCNSFTLAQALERAIRSGTRIINLQPGWPRRRIAQAAARACHRRGRRGDCRLAPVGTGRRFPGRRAGRDRGRRRRRRGRRGRRRPVGPRRGHPDPAAGRFVRLRLGQFAGDGAGIGCGCPAAFARWPFVGSRASGAAAPFGGPARCAGQRLPCHGDAAGPGWRLCCRIPIPIPIRFIQLSVARRNP